MDKAKKKTSWYMCSSIFNIFANNTCTLNSNMMDQFDDDYVNSKVEHIYVIRRPLHNTPTTCGIVAHSALLLQTNKGTHYVLEYMSDSKSYLTNVNYKMVAHKDIVDPKTYVIPEVLDQKRILPNDMIEIDGILWTKQTHGEKVTKNWSPSMMKIQMETLMSKGYSVVNYEVCHTAQERTRSHVRNNDQPETYNLSCKTCQLCECYTIQQEGVLHYHYTNCSNCVKCPACNDNQLYKRKGDVGNYFIPTINFHLSRYCKGHNERNPSTLNEAFKFFGYEIVLCPLLTYNIKDITSKYRELSINFHPDKCGGSDAKFKELQKHYEILKLFYDI